MSEHTPLPWRWDNAALLGPKQRGATFDDCILRCLGNCGPMPEDEDYIARACNSYYDLLAALEAAIAAFEYQVFSCHAREAAFQDVNIFARPMDYQELVANMYAATAEPLQKARAAIAKAKNTQVTG